MQSAFIKHASWYDRVELRDIYQRPVWEGHLLQLLELEQQDVPLAADAIIFLLLATRQLQLDGKQEEGVANLIQDVADYEKSCLPTQQQREWMDRLGLGRVVVKSSL